MLNYLDLADPAFSTRGPEVAQAREAGWCARTPYGLAVLRHREAGQLLRDRRLRQGSHNWPGAVGIAGSFADFWSRSVIAQEGEGHKLLRRVVQTALAPDYIAGLVPAFEALAARLVDALPDRFEAVGALTAPFSAGVLGLLLDLDDDAAGEMGRDASTLGLAMGVRAPDHQDRVNAAHDRLAAQAGAMLTARRPGLAQRMDEAASALGVTDRQTLVDLLVIAIFGAVDTTRGQLAFLLELLADHPDQWQALRADPALASAAVEESIRHRPTTTWATRQALARFSFGGVEIAEGQILHILVHASAVEGLVPPGFDITVKRPLHFGFGGGAHHCLGAMVARADMAAALRVMAGRWPGLARDGAARYQPDSGNTAPKWLPLRITR